MINFNVKMTEQEASTFIDFVTKNTSLTNKITNSIYFSGMRKGIFIGIAAVATGFYAYVTCCAVKNIRNKK